MHLWSRLLPAVALSLISALPLQAASLTVTNNTEFEVYYLGMYDENSGGATLGLRTLMPGQNFHYENAGNLSRLTFDIGTCNLVFDGIKNPSSEDLNYVLTLDMEYSGLPSLTPANADPGDNDTVYFDQALYFIPDEESAQQVCPAVLKWWQSAHPNLPVVWTGEWDTLKDGVMSVCTFRLGDDPAEAAEKAGILQGDVQYYSTEKTFDFTDFWKLTSKDQALAKGAVKRGDTCMATINFGPEEWIAELTFDEGPFADSPHPTMRMSTWRDESTLTNMMNTLKSMKYRPLFMQLFSGEHMDTDMKLFCWKDEQMPDQESAEKLIMESEEFLNQSGEATALEVYFIPSDQWEEAIQGKAEHISGFNLRLGTSRNIRLYYQPEIAGIVQMLTQN